jgi:hypothetical protein
VVVLGRKLLPVRKMGRVGEGGRTTETVTRDDRDSYERGRGRVERATERELRGGGGGERDDPSRPQVFIFSTDVPMPVFIDKHYQAIYIYIYIYIYMALIPPFCIGRRLN